MNPAVEVFRHAMAIDEFRRMFRIKRWKVLQIFKPNPHSQRKSFPDQDIRQVWFAGCHSDVGGGFVEEQSALSKFPLLWLLNEAKAHGLRIRTQMVNHLVLGKPRKNARTYTKPDARGPLHKSLTFGWKLIEWIPKSVKLRDWPKQGSFLGRYIPMGEPRYIPENSLIHKSVIERMQRVPTYRPINLPTAYQIEP
jgi:uncharacterized protein (DUF2235 family)